jgi:hypothetical protein
MARLAPSPWNRPAVTRPARHRTRQLCNLVTTRHGGQRPEPTDGRLLRIWSAALALVAARCRPASRRGPGSPRGVTVPEWAEILFAVGAEARRGAVTFATIRQASVVPVVGGFVDANLEIVRTPHVVGARGPGAHPRASSNRSGSRPSFHRHVVAGSDRPSPRSRRVGAPSAAFGSNRMRDRVKRSALRWLPSLG